MEGDTIPQENVIGSQGSNKKKILIISLTSIIVLAIIITGIFILSGDDEISERAEETIQIIKNIKDNETAQRLIMQPLLREITAVSGQPAKIMFILKNDLENSETIFSYNLKIRETKSSNKCALTQTDLEGFVPRGTQVDIGPVNPVQEYREAITIIPTVEENNCVFRIDIEVTQDGNTYASNYMDVLVL